MNNKLFNAAKALSQKMSCSMNDFDSSTEHLEEGFALVRASEQVAAEICAEQDLDPRSVELVFMCLKPQFSGGKTFSLPHQHAHRSLTAVIPLTRGGTFLPDAATPKRMRLHEGPCLIEGNQPHAFGMVGDEPFIAALAVANLEGKTEPIRRDDGKYDTSILQVINYNGQCLEIAA